MTSQQTTMQSRLPNQLLGLLSTLNGLVGGGNRAAGLTIRVVFVNVPCHIFLVLSKLVQKVADCFVGVVNMWPF